MAWNRDHGFVGSWVHAATMAGKLASRFAARLRPASEVTDREGASKSGDIQRERRGVWKSRY